METPPFTMTWFQSAHGQVAVWCKYSSSETDDRVTSYVALRWLLNYTLSSLWTNARSKVVVMIAQLKSGHVPSHTGLTFGEL